MPKQPSPVPRSVIAFLYRLLTAKELVEVNVAAGILLQDLGAEPSESQFEG